MKEDVIKYYGGQLDKVREARKTVTSPWGQQWLAVLEKRLSRQMQYRLIDGSRYDVSDQS